MYLDHFGLTVNPFGLSPRLDFLYKSGTFEESMAHLIFGLDNAEAITMITGPIGTGKTMAIQSFLSHLGPKFAFALITNTRVNSVELLKLILEDLEVDFPRPCDKSDLLILFKDFLLKISSQGKRLLVVIDEAQNLAPEVLEEIRLLTNLGQGNTQPVQIILVGQPELETVVGSAGLAQLRQRIRVHYRLDPLSAKEIVEYVNHRMSIAGCTVHVFKKDALKRLHELSGGVPRVVNSIAGNALLSAFVAGRTEVVSEDVEPPDPALLGDSGSLVDRVLTEVSDPESGVPTPERESMPKPETMPKPDAVAEFGHRVQEGSGRGVQWKWLWGVSLFVLLAAAAWFLIPGDTIQELLSRFDETAPVEASPPADEEVAETAAQAVVEIVEPKQSLPDSALSGPAAQPAPTKETPEAEVPVEIVAPVRHFVAHISSFQTEDRAVNYVNRLRPLTEGVFMRKILLQDRTWYRVYLGPFVDETEALAGVALLKEKEELKYFRIRRLEDAPTR